MGGAVLVSGSGRGGRALPLAAAIAVEAALDRGEPVLLADLTAEPRPRSATLFASPGARELEGYLKEAGLACSARGHLCHLAVGADLDALAELEAAAALAGDGLTVAHLPPALWAPALERPSLEPGAGVLLAELPRERPLAALAVAELRRRGLAAPGRLPPAAGARRAAGAGGGEAAAVPPGRVSRASFAGSAVSAATSGARRCRQCWAHRWRSSSAPCC